MLVDEPILIPVTSLSSRSLCLFSAAWSLACGSVQFSISHVLPLAWERTSKENSSKENSTGLVVGELTANPDVLNRDVDPMRSNKLLRLTLCLLAHAMKWSCKKKRRNPKTPTFSLNETVNSARHSLPQRSPRHFVSVISKYPFMGRCYTKLVAAPTSFAQCFRGGGCAPLAPFVPDSTVHSTTWYQWHVMQITRIIYGWSQWPGYLIAL